MVTKASLLSAASKKEVDVEISGSKISLAVTLWAPSGFRFVATESHSCSHTHFGCGASANTVYGTAMEDLNLGLEACTNPDCDICHEG